tara:strand:- start:355 stop:1044 length:690 start_codon:yes stop_codon:yes gene_type:complete
MPMKLTYFNGRGLAETSRILMAISGEEYEDFRYPLNIIDWEKHLMEKEEFDQDKADGKLVKSLNKVPFLEVDGMVSDDHNETSRVIIPQSKSIERFLARRFNMMGENNTEYGQIDSICECVRDFKDMYQKVRALPSEEKDAGMNEWFTVTLVERLTLLENLLGEDGFAVGNKLSLADVVLYSFITQFFDNKEASYNATLATPRLRKIVDSVGVHEKVVQWLEVRPKTSF